MQTRFDGGRTAASGCKGALASGGGVPLDIGPAIAQTAPPCGAARGWCRDPPTITGSPMSRGRWASRGGWRSSASARATGTPTQPALALGARIQPHHRGWYEWGVSSVGGRPNTCPPAGRGLPGRASRLARRALCGPVRSAGWSGSACGGRGAGRVSRGGWIGAEGGVVGCRKIVDNCG